MVVSLSFIRQYRCAVYLNNAATTFISRGDYLQACLSSRESLSLIETIVRPCKLPVPEGATTEESNDSVTFQQSYENEHDDLSSKIEDVNKRLATIPTKTTTTTPFVPMEILCYDGSPDSRSLLLEQQKKTSRISQSLTMPIWISDMIVDEIDDGEELLLNVTEIVPSIMLLNYALCHLCYYKCTNSQVALDGTLRLFQMSMNVLCIQDQLLSRSSCIENDNSLNYTEGRLFVAMAILTNIKCVLVEWENCSSVLQYSGGQCTSSSLSLPETIHISLSPEMIQDLDALQRISNDWIVFSQSSYIATMHRASNAGAA